jgi:5-methyltetrahydrofolate--homocysteine methyltransferase
MMGVRPRDAVTALAALGVAAAGANCGRGPEEMEQIAAELADARPDGLLLVAQSTSSTTPARPTWPSTPAPCRSSAST